MVLYNTNSRIDVLMNLVFKYVELKSDIYLDKFFSVKNMFIS